LSSGNKSAHVIRGFRPQASSSQTLRPRPWAELSEYDFNSPKIGTTIQSFFRRKKKRVLNGMISRRSSSKEIKYPLSNRTRLEPNPLFFSRKKVENKKNSYLDRTPRGNPIRIVRILWGRYSNTIAIPTNRSQNLFLSVTRRNSGLLSYRTTASREKHPSQTIPLCEWGKVIKGG